LKVTEVRVTIVSVPFTKPEAWRFGRAWGVTNALVEVQTDEGLVGLGEAPGNPAVSVIAEAIRSMGDLLIGRDPLQVVPALRFLRGRGWHHYQYLGNTASAALEMALWDILGKARSCPVSDFFGGLQRAAVPFYWYLPVADREPARAAAEAVEGVERGFRTMYIKVGFDLLNDLAITRAVREAVGPAVGLRVDANEGWAPHEAARALAELEDLELEFCEQPIDMHDIEGLALLRARTRTPIAANQTAWLEHDVLDIVRHRAADVVVTDPHQAGGLSALRDVAAICEIARLPVVKHSFGDLGITTAATLQLLGTLPDPSLAHQSHLELLESDLLATPFVFSGENLEVPRGPGIGVELDADAVARYAALYEQLGEFSGYAAHDAPSPVAGASRSSA
jgi:L-alanine-DL-glutamate epimerase-like enolase superfamily enzyme